ncbi:4F2 cell-surface antigen heavy chain [Plecturocebus cupreus]
MYCNGTLSIFTDIQKFFDNGISRGTAIRKEKIMVIKASIRKAFGIIHPFIQTNNGTWMNLETIILSKLTQEQKAKHRMFLLIEMGFHHVVQAALELLSSGNLTATASQSARITGMSHCLANVEMESHYVAQAGLKLLASSSPVTLASRSIETTGINHYALTSFY